VLTIVAGLTHSTIDALQANHIVKSNLGSFLPGDLPPPLIALADAIDVLEFWQMALVALALRKIGRISTGKAAGIVVFFWAGVTVFRVAAVMLQTLANGMHR